MRHQDLWFDASVQAMRDLTPSVREFTLHLGVAPPRFAPGAHVNIRVLIDGKIDQRSYSLIGMAGADTLRIAVKRVPGSRGGSRYMWSLPVGARLAVSAPETGFELLPGSAEYLLIAGGIGITPLVGMAQVLAAQAAPMRMVYAARSTAELAYADQLRGWLGDRFTAFADDTGADDTGADKTSPALDLAGEIARLHPDGEAYFCGPLAMLDAMRRHWDAAGRKPARLRYETFGSSGRFAAQAFEVRVPRLGLTLMVPESQSMLDTLAAAGVDVLSDCRRGECGLCALDVLELGGQIDHRDVFLSAAQQQAGQKICACVSRIAGGHVTIDPAYRGDAILSR